MSKNKRVEKIVDDILGETDVDPEEESGEEGVESEGDVHDEEEAEEEEEEEEEPLVPEAAAKVPAKLPKMPKKKPNGTVPVTADTVGANGTVTVSADPFVVAAKNDQKQRPTMRKQVEEALKNLNDRSGTSVYAIKKYIFSGYPEGDHARISFLIKKTIKTLLVKELIIQTKGFGATGSFKLSSKSTKERKEELKAKEKQLKAMAKEKAKKEKVALKQLEKAQKRKAAAVVLASIGGKAAKAAVSDTDMPTTMSATKKPRVKKSRKSVGFLVVQAVPVPKAGKKAAKPAPAAATLKPKNPKVVKEVEATETATTSKAAVAGKGRRKKNM